MEKLRDLLHAGQTPWMGLYLRALAVIYVAGAIFHFSNLLGVGFASFEETPVPSRIADMVYGQFYVISALGLWMRRPWGVLSFFIIALSQLILYWGFTNLFATNNEHLFILQGITNIQISTLAIFMLIRMKGR